MSGRSSRYWPREHKILSYAAQYRKVHVTGSSSRVVREAALGRRGWVLGLATMPHGPRSKRASEGGEYSAKPTPGCCHSQGDRTEATRRVPWGD